MCVCVCAQRGRRSWDSPYCAQTHTHTNMPTRPVTGAVTRMRKECRMHTLKSPFGVFLHVGDEPREKPEKRCPES